MPTPFPENWDHTYEVDPLLTVYNTYSDRFYVVGGGGNIECSDSKVSQWWRCNRRGI